MKDSGSILPVIEPAETPRTIACHPFQIDVTLAADSSLVLTLAGSTIQISDNQTIYTGECPQIAVTVKFPGLGGGTLDVYEGTAVATLADTDGDGLITFERSSPSTFEIDVKYQVKVPPRVTKPGTSLAPKPVVPSRRVKLMPKIGYPPPDREDK